MVILATLRRRVSASARLSYARSDERARFVAGLIRATSLITSKEPEIIEGDSISTQTTMRGPQLVPTALRKDRRHGLYNTAANALMVAGDWC